MGWLTHCSLLLLPGVAVPDATVGLLVLATRDAITGVTMVSVLPPDRETDVVQPVPASGLPVENNGTVPAIMDAGGIAVLSDGGDGVPAMRGGGGGDCHTLKLYGGHVCGVPILPFVA